MFAPAFCLVWVVKRQWDVGRPAPRPPPRFPAMRSLTSRRCRGAVSPTPRGGERRRKVAGGMNFSPTGYLLAGVDRKVAEGSRPLPTMQRIKGWQWQGSVNGLRTRGAREGGSPPLCSWRAVARERVVTQGPSEPFRPRKLGQPFRPGPLCRSATSPRTAGSHP